jgi:hypothetical protein
LGQLAIPFIIAFRTPARATTHRKRRDIGIDVAANHRGSLDPHVYIDAIGVPKGVLNEFKARNKITAGFESVLFWWPTINKNVRDAIKGLAEQLERTNQMAWENRLALDIMLAQMGRV